jgi:hypothetical protein
VHLVVEDGDADAFGGEHVGVGAWQAFDEPVQSEATQVVGHLRRGVVAAEESGQTPEQVERYQPCLDNARRLRELITELEALTINAVERAEGWGS